MVDATPQSQRACGLEDIALLAYLAQEHSETVCPQDPRMEAPAAMVETDARQEHTPILQGAPRDQESAWAPAATPERVGSTPTMSR